jgi:F-type H+-transporting ATPase subunit a
MGYEFLARIRRTSLMAGAMGSLFAAVYASYATGLAFAAGVAWSLANLALLETIVRSVTGGAHDKRRAYLAAAGNLALLVAGGFLLVKLRVLPLAAGFTLPFAVIFLKAASRALLESKAWAAITRSPWRATALVAALAAVAYFALVPLTRAQSEHAAGGAAATEHGSAGRQHPAGAATPEEHAAAGEHAAEGGEPKQSKEFPDLVTLALEANHENPLVQKLLAVPGAESMTPAQHEEAVEKKLQGVSSIGFSLLVALLLCVVAWKAAQDKGQVPGKFRNVVESLVEPVYNQIVDILGPKYGPRYVPFLGSLFVYILFMNLFGILPFMKSPTSNLNVTVALALTVFVYVQYTAVTELGFLGWLDHMAGTPRSPVEWGLVPLAFPIHLIGELAKPVSLSCRLFGNIFGEDMLLVGFAGLGVTLMKTLGLGVLPFGVPFQFVFLFLALLTSFVQALVFSMLSTIYFLLMLPHDHDHGHDHGHGEEAHHPAH